MERTGCNEEKEALWTGILDRFNSAHGSYFPEVCLAFSSLIIRCFANYAGRVSRLAGNGGAVDVNLQFRKTALDVITELAFGGFYKGNNAKDIDLMALLDEFNIANTVRNYAPLLYIIFKSIPLKSFNWARSLDTFCEVISGQM